MIEDFWDWLPKAYGEVDDEPVFTKYNMEVAFAAGAETEGKRIEQAEQAPICAHGVSKIKCDFCKQTEQAQPVGEVLNERGEVDWISFVPPAGTSLYTAPPQHQPLTKENLLYLYNQLPNWGMDMDSLPRDLEKFARAVEQEHGIKEKNT